MADSRFNMHIPDGFLSIPVSAAAGVFSLGGLAVAVAHLKRRVGDRLVPFMGVMAAFIFAAQMFNFPVAGGTSGHLLGGALAAIVLGPAAATVVLTIVLVVQCILFQDGGLIALGANTLNMAIVGVWVPWILYVALRFLPGRAGRHVAVFIAAWASVVGASALAAFELGLSGVAPLAALLPMMLAAHALIGIGEGIITVLVVGFLKKVKPELMSNAVFHDAA